MIYSCIYHLQLALIWLSGANLEDLRAIEGDNITGQSHQVRALLGAIIFITFLITSVTTTWMAWTFGIGRYWAAGVGLLAGGLKLAWDRRVAVAASQGIAWARMLLAVPVSILLALPVALSLFGEYASDIAKQKDLEDANNNFKTRIATRERLRTRRDSLRQASLFWNRIATAEENGLTQEQAGLLDQELRKYGVPGLTGVPGCEEGSRCATYKQRAEAYGEALSNTESQLQSLPTRTELKDSLARESEEIESESVNAVAQLNAIHDQSREQPIIGVLFLIVVGAYTTVDLLPVLERILSASAYDQVQGERIDRDERQWRERARLREWGHRVDVKLKVQYLKRVLQDAESASRDDLLKLLAEVNDVLEDFPESFGFADVTSSDESEASNQEEREESESTIPNNTRDGEQVGRGSQDQAANDTGTVNPDSEANPDPEVRGEVLEVPFNGFSENGHLLLPPPRYLLLPSPNGSMRQ